MFTVAAIREKILEGEPIVIMAGESDGQPAWFALIGLNDTAMVRETTASGFFTLLQQIIHGVTK